MVNVSVFSMMAITSTDQNWMLSMVKWVISERLEYEAYLLGIWNQMKRMAQCRRSYEALMQAYKAAMINDGVQATAHGQLYT